MSERFLRCPHCRAPHEARVTVCPTTRKRIEASSPPPVSSRPGHAEPRRGATDPVPQDRAKAATKDDLIGQTLGGRYVIHGVLGEGGMGTVYDAEHLALKRPVAVKVLNPTQAAKSTAVKRFQHEARAAGAIGHPNICEVYDLGRLDDGSPYLVMEKLVGQTLSDVIKRVGPLPFATAAEIVFQVLSGLAAAHDKGIVHRDIKPENVFLSERIGLPEIVKLLDFGVSKMLVRGPDENDEDFDLTRTGMVMGTPYYMSPEQARGDRNLDARVDLYACGVVLYESLTGKRPFVAQNYNALLIAILSGKPRPIAELRPDIPPPFARVIARAMARSRSERYQNAAELQRDLLPLRGDLSGLPPSPEALERERARVRRGSNPSVAGDGRPPISSRPGAEATRIEGRTSAGRGGASGRPSAATGSLPQPSPPPPRSRADVLPPMLAGAGDWEEDAPTEIMRPQHRPVFDRPNAAKAPAPPRRVIPAPPSKDSEWNDKTEVLDQEDEDVELISEGDETERRESPFERKSRRH